MWYHCNTKGDNMQLSDQALGALMLALQNSLLNQTDIVPDDGLVVENPPVVDMSAPEQESQSSAVFDAYVDAIE